jgi:bifunctional isochorismate lyase/aryl carrier protein
VPIVYAVRVPGQPAGGAGHVLLEPPAEAEPRAVADVVEPQAGDIVLAAKRYSALVGTRLRARLKEPGRDQLVVGAAARRRCCSPPRTPGCRTWSPSWRGDAVVDRTAAGHAMALQWLATTCAVVVVTDAVVEAFRGQRVDAEAV